MNYGRYKLTYLRSNETCKPSLQMAKVRCAAIDRWSAKSNFCVAYSATPVGWEMRLHGRCWVEIVALFTSYHKILEFQSDLTSITASAAWLQLPPVLSERGWGFPILHDITQILRIGDIAFVQPHGEPRTVEIKTRLAEERVEGDEIVSTYKITTLEAYRTSLKHRARSYQRTRRGDHYH